MSGSVPRIQAPPVTRTHPVCGRSKHAPWRRHTPVLERLVAVRGIDPLRPSLRAHHVAPSPIRGRREDDDATVALAPD
jgi:hypothetical protein